MDKSLRNPSRWVTVLASFLLAMWIITPPLFAANQSVTLGDLTYSINTSTFTASVTGVTSKSITSATIPSTISWEDTEYSVTSIDNYVFNGCSSLRELTIEDGEKTLSLGYNKYYPSLDIGKGLFYDCPLEKLYLGRNLSYDSSVRTGFSPFCLQTSLSYVTIGNTVTSISNYAFRACTRLNSLSIGISVTSISEHAFQECSGLTSLTIPGSVTSIENDAFNGCSSLKELTIEDGEKSLNLGCHTYASENSKPNGLFYDCPLEKLYLGRNLRYETRFGGNYSPFYNNSSLTNVTVGNTVTSIGEYAFYGCTGLTSLTIPGSVMTIENFAFNGCSSLRELSFEDGAKILSLGYGYYNGKGLLYDCPLEKLYLGRNLSYEIDSKYGYSPFYEKTSLGEVTIGKTVTSIGAYAFSGCSGLSSLTIPSSVTSIGSLAFDGGKELSEVSFEDGETEILVASNAFNKCPIEIVTVGRNINGAPFKAMESITSLTIRDCVTYISNHAFYGCTGLTLLSIPNSITSIGESAFVGCIGLTSLTIGNSVTTIHSSAFSGCIGLTSLTIPNSVTSIGESAFVGCIGLTSLTIGNSVTTIDSSAFSGCNGLTSLTIGNSVTSIGESAFLNCTGLTSLTIPNSVTTIGKSAFSGCNGLTSLTIGNSMTSIGESVFRNCNGLTSLTIPSSVTSIRNYAFNGCTGLKELFFEDGSETLSLGYNTNSSSSSSSREGLFCDCPLEKLYLGRNLSYETSSYYCYAPFYKQTSLTDVTIGNTVISIGASAFSGCIGLTSLTIPNSVTSIGSSALSDCTGLTTLTIPNSVTSIGSSAFSGCSGLTSLTIGNSVTSIGSSALSGCSGLTSFTIPSSVTNIDYKAFFGCNSLKELTFEDGSKTISLGENSYSSSTGEGLFYDSPIEKLYLGRDLSYSTYHLSGYSPFCNSTTLKEVIVGDSVTTIGESAFRGCSGLTEFTIPSSVTTIGSSAFDGCTGLFSLTIPGSVKSIGNFTFNGCSSLKELFFEDGEETLSLGYHTDRYLNGKGLFYDCPLEKLYLGRDLSYETSTYYGYSPFYQMTSLSDVIIGNTVSSIGEYAFSGCSGITSLSIPGSVTSIGNCAFNGCISLRELICANGEDTLSLGYNSYDRYSTNGKGLFYDCPLKKLYLGRNLSYETSTYYGYSPFYQMTSLSDVTIGNTVTSIANYAFNGCKGLKELTFEDGADTLRLEYNAFSSYSSKGLFYDSPLEKLYLGRNLSYEKDYYLFYQKATLKNVTIGNSVTSIDENMFFGCTGLTSLIIGNSVTSIGDSAFKGCIGLSSLSVPNSVNSIGESAFSGCSLLSSFSIPNSVSSIGASTYYGCKGLTSLTIGNSVTSIGDSAFEGCIGLTSLTVPNSVSSIGSSAFSGCNNLLEIVSHGTTPAQIESSSFSDNTYTYCYVHIPQGSLNAYKRGWSQFKHFFESTEGKERVYTVDTPGSLINMINVSEVNEITYLKLIGKINGTDILSMNKMPNIMTLDLSEATIVSGGMPYYEQDNVKWGTSDNELGEFWSYNLSLLKKLYLPNDLQVLGSNAFQGKIYIESLTIPASVTEIRSSSLSGCKNLNELIIEDSQSQLKVGSGVLSKGSLKKLYLGRNITSSLFSGEVLLSDVTIGNSVTSIGWSAFEGCTGLTSLTIPNSVTSIGWSAFKGCTGLTSLTIPNSVTSIGRSAFTGCRGLTSLTIPNSVTSIGESALEGCRGLTSLTIPNSVTSIASSTFKGCSGLTSLTIPNSVSAIGESSFSGCSGLTSLVIPNSVTSIASFTFEGCSGLISLIIPNSVTSIGESAFKDCSGLVSLTIPSPVSSIGNFTFNGCSSLKELVVEDGTESLRLGYNTYSYSSSSSKGLFHDCPLVKLYLGRNISYSDYSNYGYSPFYQQTSLTDVTIGNTVTSIGESAFRGCSGLTTLTIPGSVTSIANYAFNGCKGLKELTIEDGEEALSLGYNGYSDGLFYDCPLKKLYLGRDLSYNTSSSYGYSPFYQQTSLADVTIGDMVTKLVENSFGGCTALSSLTIPNSVTSIGASAFEKCEGLESALLSINLSEISSSLFAGCKSLKSISIPDPVIKIGSRAFDGCSALSEITFPGSLREIGSDAFAGCTALGTVNMINPIPAVIETNTFDSAIFNKAVVNVPEGSYALYWIHPYWSKFVDIQNWVPGTSTSEDYTLDNVTYHITSEADGTVEVSAVELIGSRAAATEIVIPETVTIGGKDYRVAGIANGGFKNTSIVSVTLPATIGYVGVEAFKGCDELKEVICRAVLPPSANSNSFDQTTYSTARLGVPQEAIDAYKAHAVWSLFEIGEAPDKSDIMDIIPDYDEHPDSHFDIYNLRGVLIMRNATDDYLKDLQPDVYILRQGAKTKKVLVK